MPGTKHFGRMQYNVSRGLREIVAPRQTDMQIARIEEYLARHPYHPSTPELTLAPNELATYHALLAEWDILLAKARKLHKTAEERQKRVRG